MEKRANKIIFITAAVIIIVLVLYLTKGFGIWAGTSYNLTIGESPVLGNANAPVTIYEFSDLSCPFCAAAEGFNQEAIAALKSQNPDWEPAVPNIIKDYVDTGKARIVFKYYPGHGASPQAHLIGYALNEQGLFWPFAEKAFANQNKLTDSQSIMELAKEAGADIPRLNQQINNTKYYDAIQNDIQLGKDVGIRGTPTFFVNGVKIEGAQPYSVFKAAIDKALA